MLADIEVMYPCKEDTMQFSKENFIFPKFWRKIVLFFFW